MFYLPAACVNKDFARCVFVLLDFKCFAVLFKSVKCRLFWFCRFGVAGADRLRHSAVNFFDIKF